MYLAVLAVDILVTASERLVVNLTTKGFGSVDSYFYHHSDEVFSTGWGALTGASCWVVTFGFRLGI